MPYFSIVKAKVKTYPCFKVLTNPGINKYVCPSHTEICELLEEYVCMVIAIPFLGHLDRLKGNSAESYDLGHKLRPLIVSEGPGPSSGIWLVEDHILGD